MRPLDVFRPPPIRTAWEYAVQGSVWRLVPAPGGRVVGEDRDTAAKAASFFCIDLGTGRPLWERVTFDEPWWLGIEAVHRETVVLHRFAKPDMPEHKGVIVLDAGTGTVLWEDREAHLLLAAGDSLFTGRPTLTGRAVREHRYRSGEMVRDWGDEFSGVRDVARTMPPEPGPEPLLPVPASLFAGDLSAAVARSLGELPPEAPKEAAEVAAWGPLLVLHAYLPLAGHTPATPAYRSELRFHRLPRGERAGVLALDGRVQAPIPAAFMILDGRLLCVRERRTVLCLEHR